MKATGIVRRIDELGRVVIPKEIRKTLRIREGDPLEIYTDTDELLLKKYSPVASFEGESDNFASAMAEISERPCIVTDTDKVVSVSSQKLKDLVGAQLHADFYKTIKERKSLLLVKDTGDLLPVARGAEFDFESEVIVPILSDGELIGSVVLLEKNKEKPLNGTDVKFASLGASFFARQFG